MLIQVVFSCHNIICNLNDNMFDTIDSEKRFSISEHFFFCSFAFASAVRSQKLPTFITIFPRHRWIRHDTLSLETKLTVLKQVQKEWHNCIQCAVNVLYSEDVYDWFGVSVVSGFFRCHCHIHTHIYEWIAVAPYKSFQYEQVICTKIIDIMKKRPKNGTHYIFSIFLTTHLSSWNQ